MYNGIISKEKIIIIKLRGKFWPEAQQNLNEKVKQQQQMNIQK